MSAPSQPCVCRIRPSRAIALFDSSTWLFATTKERRAMLQPVCHGKLYTCRGCKRRVPWCFGASGDMPHHCDDCWAAAHRASP